MVQTNEGYAVRWYFHQFCRKVMYTNSVSIDITVDSTVSNICMLLLLLSHLSVMQIAFTWRMNFIEDSLKELAFALNPATFFIRSMIFYFGIHGKSVYHRIRMFGKPFFLPFIDIRHSIGKVKWTQIEIESHFL